MWVQAYRRQQGSFWKADKAWCKNLMGAELAEARSELADARAALQRASAAARGERDEACKKAKAAVRLAMAEAGKSALAHLDTALKP